MGSDRVGFVHHLVASTLWRARDGANGSGGADGANGAGGGASEGASSAEIVEAKLVRLGGEACVVLLMSAEPAMVPLLIERLHALPNVSVSARETTPWMLRGAAAEATPLVYRARLDVTARTNQLELLENVCGIVSSHGLDIEQLDCSALPAARAEAAAETAGDTTGELAAIGFLSMHVRAFGEFDAEASLRADLARLASRGVDAVLVPNPQ